MGFKLTAEQRENLTYIFNTHTQVKHFLTLHDDLASIRGKKNIIEKVFKFVEEGIIPYKKFLSWLSLHQLHGNNHFFVYELNDHKITEALISNLSENAEHLIKDITQYSPKTLKETVLVNIEYDKKNERGIFTYIAPANIIKRVKLDDSTMQDVIENHIYYENVIVDYNAGNIVISINPTAFLVSVDNVQKDSKTGFEPIANSILSNLRDILGDFTIKKPVWIYNALDRLAEEATSHNNPKITNEYMKAIPIISEAVYQLCEKFSLEDPAAFDYLVEEFLLAFENILIDKYGEDEEDTQIENNSFRVFELKGDQINTFVHVGSRTSTLNEGPAAKVAKATRMNSDLTRLGIEKTVDGEKYRFYITVGPDYYLIKNNSTKFTREEVIWDVIYKLNSYREEIQTTSYSGR